MGIAIHLFVLHSTTVKSNILCGCQKCQTPTFSVCFRRGRSPDSTQLTRFDVSVGPNFGSTATPSTYFRWGVGASSTCWRWLFTCLEIVRHFGSHTLALLVYCG